LAFVAVKQTRDSARTNIPVGIPIFNNTETFKVIHMERSTTYYWFCFMYIMNGWHIKWTRMKLVH